MNKEQETKVINALVNFIVRVADGDVSIETRSERVAVFPQVAELLLNYKPNPEGITFSMNIDKDKIYETLKELNENYKRNHQAAAFE